MAPLCKGSCRRRRLRGCHPSHPRKRIPHRRAAVLRHAALSSLAPAQADSQCDGRRIRGGGFHPSHPRKRIQTSHCVYVGESDFHPSHPRKRIRQNCPNTGMIPCAACHRCRVVECIAARMAATFSAYGREIAQFRGNEIHEIHWNWCEPPGKSLFTRGSHLRSCAHLPVF